MTNLKNIGYNNDIENQIDADTLKEHEIARVVSVNRNKYVINNGNGNILAEASGSLVHTSKSAIDLPTTGDWVYVDFYDNNSFAIIHSVVPRVTLLKRKTAGRDVNIQLIAANLDVAFIVQSVDYNLNIKRLERYLVMINESKIRPVILLSKCDLLSQDEIDKIKNNILEVIPNVKIIAFSNLNGDNIDRIKDFLISGKTYCLLGSSGVGKTTLLNSILGNEKYETQAVSKKENKGKHTTTRRELIPLENGSVLIDTPGMRELGNLSVDEGLEETFTEMSELSTQCKFSNCAHITEKGCAILDAIENNEITQERYDNYIKIKKENDFNKMPVYKRKAKNKSLSKTVKSSKKRKYK